ncbi:MAG: L,D-transpeptidase family protein [Candidatus Omnitrophica bacterium]|nr:L,D-transpeptidase family protein [Candidatus Omnitrophota bacterium]
MRRNFIIGILIVLAIFFIMKMGHSKKQAGSGAEVEVEAKAEAKVSSPLPESEIALNMALEIKTNNPEQAVEALDKVIADFPQTIEAEKAIITIADIYNKGQDTDMEKQALNRLIEQYPNSELKEKALDRVATINLDSFFSRAPTANSIIYEVQPGDSLYKIAKQYHTNVELIQKTNNLNSSLIKPGMKLKVITSVFSLFVSKTDCLMTLKADGELVKVYKIGIGRDNSTPVGQFKIVNRIISPVWYKTGAIVPAGSAENILGTRWLGLSEPGYGIHGTVDNQPIQQQKTQGCVRMMNDQVEELFVIVPVGTEIVIVD